VTEDLESDQIEFLGLAHEASWTIVRPP
jgi:hypothetical protein